MFMYVPRTVANIAHGVMPIALPPLKLLSLQKAIAMTLKMPATGCSSTGVTPTHGLGVRLLTMADRRRCTSPMMVAQPMPTVLELLWFMLLNCSPSKEALTTSHTTGYAKAKNLLMVALYMIICV